MDQPLRWRGVEELSLATRPGPQDTVHHRGHKALIPVGEQSCTAFARGKNVVWAQDIDGLSLCCKSQ